MVHTPAHGRSKKHSKRNRRFLILCGGVVTEIDYFDYVKSTMRRYAYPNWDVKRHVALDGEGVDPLTLAKDAVCRFRQDAKDAKKEEYDPFTCVWVVTDVDDFGEKVQQAQATVDAAPKRVKLIISNPCFEVWLIDHKRSCPESYKDTAMCQELAERLQVVDAAKGHSHKHVSIEQIEGHYLDAIRNARLHMRDAEQQSLRTHHPSVSKHANYAPWTDVPDVLSTLITECTRVSGWDFSAEL